MPNLDVDSDGLRSAGRDISDQREEYMSEDNTAMLDVFTQGHMAISTGGFPAGALAMQRLVELYGNVTTAHQTVIENLIGLASGLHIVADTYDDEEHDQALAFAFQRPGAPEEIRGQPGYVNPDTGFEDWVEEGDGEVDMSELGEVPEGGHREYEYIRSPDNHHPRIMTRITHVYDGDDNLVASHYVVNSPDGSTTYYTEVPREGGSERVNEVTIDEQGGHATSNESVDQFNDYYEDQREQIQEELDEYGLFEEENEGGAGGGGAASVA